METSILENSIIVTILSFLIITITIGNGLVLFAWITQSSLRNPSNAYIASLALADILIGLTVLPLDIAIQLKASWATWTIVCQIRIVLIVSLTTCSIFHLIAIAWDRYRIVIFGVPYIQQRSLQSVLQMVVVMWIIAIWISIPPVLDASVWPKDQKTCQFHRTLGWVLHSSFGSFIFPIILMIKMYSSVYLEIKKRFQTRQRIRRGEEEISNVELEFTSEEQSFDHLKSDGKDVGDVSKSQIKSPAQVLSSPTVQKKTFPIRNDKLSKVKVSLKQENKAKKMLGIIIGCFLVCWLPFYTVHLCSSMNPDFFITSHRLFQITAYLGYTNSAINPIIYAIYNLEFQIAFKRIFICRRM